MKSFPILIFSFLSLGINAQDITQHDFSSRMDDISSVITYLSSERMEGREAGTRGSAAASEFIALMMQLNGLEPVAGNNKWFQEFTLIRFNTNKKDDLEDDYTDGDYFLEGDTSVLNPTVKIDTLRTRNVIGVIYGKDTTRTIIIGAHYDHLGKRNGKIYSGADDNVSGVTGMLELARAWKLEKEKPACNLIFAAWTAEEKGQLGSKYFVRNSIEDPEDVIICFNLDMISRSAPEDTLSLQLSIGTKPESESLRLMAGGINRGLSRPFELDLWDVTGHTGSDYRFFSEKGIPVMTFFSGYNSDYHTPGDTYEKVDLVKMNNILSLIDECVRRLTINMNKQ